MKIRQGFVSNSSSSSFIMISKNELTSEKLQEIFGLPKGHILEDIGLKVGKTLLNCGEKCTLEEFLDDYGYTLEDLDGEITSGYGGKFFALAKEAHEKGWYIYTGSCSDEGWVSDGIEAFLCSQDLDISNEDLAIYKEGGY